MKKKAARGKLGVLIRRKKYPSGKALVLSFVILGDKSFMEGTTWKKKKKKKIRGKTSGRTGKVKKKVQSQKAFHRSTWCHDQFGGVQNLKLLFLTYRKSGLIGSARGRGGEKDKRFNKRKVGGLGK